MRKKIRIFTSTSVVALALLSARASAVDPALRPDQMAFRALYEELVETNTTLSEGSCTLAAERMAARLKAAGMADSQLTLFAHPDHPKEGGLVAVYPGTSRTLKPILAIAHIDVVEAKRADWARDPFTLIEENGYFYGRGTADDKAMAATLVDTLIRFKQTGHKPKRTIKIALTNHIGQLLVANTDMLRHQMLRQDLVVESRPAGGFFAGREPKGHLDCCLQLGTIGLKAQKFARRFVPCPIRPRAGLRGIEALGPELFGQAAVEAGGGLELPTVIGTVVRRAV